MKRKVINKNSRKKAFIGAAIGAVGNLAGGIIGAFKQKRAQEKGAYFNKIKLLAKYICLLSDCDAYGFVSDFPLFIFELFSW